jgi:hypothetical protein
MAPGGFATSKFNGEINVDMESSSAEYKWKISAERTGGRNTPHSFQWLDAHFTMSWIGHRHNERDQHENLRRHFDLCQLLQPDTACGTRSSNLFIDKALLRFMLQ